MEKIKKKIQDVMDRRAKRSPGESRHSDQGTGFFGSLFFFAFGEDGETGVPVPGDGGADAPVRRRSIAARVVGMVRCNSVLASEN